MKIDLNEYFFHATNEDTELLTPQPASTFDDVDDVKAVYAHPRLHDAIKWGSFYNKKLIAFIHETDDFLVYETEEEARKSHFKYRGFTREFGIGQEEILFIDAIPVDFILDIKVAEKLIAQK